MSTLSVDIIMAKRPAYRRVTMPISCQVMQSSVPTSCTTVVASLLLSAVPASCAVSLSLLVSSDPASYGPFNYSHRSVSSFAPISPESEHLMQHNLLPHRFQVPFAGLPGPNQLFRFDTPSIRLVDCSLLHIKITILCY
ncbi:unnamed protein product [Protopolystoma xenopodis]|uniref:Uncharacterized protein n=1 Tax=Protopolystoma xenopodis TaxID=117903 RepID=A0A3S5BVB3_9PLAT|nr:unnamed protein product [Protopolystoma xenopodis]